MILVRIKRFDVSSTIRKVKTDDRKQTIAIIGQVADLRDANFFDYCTAPDCFWSAIFEDGQAEFQATRADIISVLKEIEEYDYA